MNSEIQANELAFRSLLGPSLRTAFLASFLGPFVANLWILFTAPGDGGIAAGIGAVGIFTFVGVIIALPVGFLALLLFGIPLVLAFSSAILSYPLWAILVGTTAGVLLGGCAGLVLFGPHSFVVLAVISGAVFGGLWVIIARRTIISSRSSRVT